MRWIFVETSKELAEADFYLIRMVKIRAVYNLVHCTHLPFLTTRLGTFILFQPLFHRRFPVNLELIYCSA